MRNIRFFFDEILKVIMDEKDYHDSNIHSYKSVGNIDYSKFLDCRDEIFYRLSTMVADARKIYAIAILKELEIRLDNELIDKKEEIETVIIHNSNAKYHQISKDEAEKKGMSGEPRSEELLLHEHHNKYVEISCLISDIEFFIDELQNIFSMFSIDLKDIAAENDIDIEFFTSDTSLFLPTNLNETQINLLYQSLIEGKFIPQQTNINNFFWAFGGKNGKSNGSKIQWLKNKQLLRELIIPLIKHANKKPVDLIRLVPQIFQNEENRPMKLAKNKCVLSLDSDKIAEIHKKIATC